MLNYLLDTHIASAAIKGDPARVRERLVILPMRSVMVSAVTQGELIYGLAKRGVALGALDMMIAAQAVAADALLVTRDKAFEQIAGELKLENWGSREHWNRKPG